MTSEFCYRCGHKAFFETSKPKWCPNCSSAFNRSEDTPKTTSNPSFSKTKRKSIFLDNEEEDDEDDFSDLQLDRASLVNSVEAIVDKPRFPTFEDLAIHSASPRGERYTRPEFKVEGGDIIQATRQECGKVQSSKEVGVSK